MAATELDPIFVKALKLLQSRSKESAEQLKQLLDEVIAQRRGDTYVAKDIQVKSESSRSGSKKDDNSKRREADKRNIEKLTADLTELSGESASKRPRLDPGADRDEKTKERDKRSKDKDRGQRDDQDADSKDKEHDWIVKYKQEQESRVTRDASESSGSDTDIESSAATGEKLNTQQFVFDLGELACVVCKSMELTATNGLVECQECHSLYHQDCHRPPVTDNVNDPRFVWYCSRCAKNMKKQVSKPSKHKSSAPSSSSKDVVLQKQVKAEPVSLLQPFKRMDPKSAASGKDSIASGRGLAALAANLTSKTESRPSSKADSKSASQRKVMEDPKFNPFGIPFKALKPASSGTTSSKGGSSGSSSGSKSREPSSKTERPTSGSGGGVSGLAKLASSKVTGSSTLTSSGSSSSISTSSSSTSGTKHSSSSSHASAEKRLQILKKKAASKLPDRKSMK